MPSKSFLLFTHLTLDSSNAVKGDTIEGVIVCEIGPAKGHDFVIDEKFLNDVVSQTKGKKLKVRLEHPGEGENGKVLSLVGKAGNFRRDGNMVRADVELFDVPAKKVLLTLAQQAGEFFGMSLDFLGKYGKKLKDGLYEMAVKTIQAVDFVGEPAATSKLLQNSVDSKINDMNITLPGKYVAKLGLKDPDEKSVLAALGNMQERLSTLEAEADAEKKAGEGDEPKTPQEHMARLREHMESHDGSDEHKEKALGYMDSMEASMGEGDKEDKEMDADADKDEKKMDDEEKKKEMRANQLDDRINLAVTQAVTKIMAKIGSAAPKLSAKSKEDAIEDEKEKEVTLTAEQEAECKRLGNDPKVYAANLKKFANVPVTL